MCERRKCMFYRTGRKCISNDYCSNSDYDIEQNIRICFDEDSYILDIEEQLERKEKKLQRYKDRVDLKKYKDEIKELREENAELYEDLSVQKLSHQSDIEKLDKYHQALQKIKEIAEPRFVCGLNEEADIYNKAMDRIQQIISEVE